jgi:hypothetical protein
LAQGDHLIAFEGKLAEEGKLTTTVSVVSESVSVENKDGSDRSKNYLFKTPESAITFLPRPD